MNAESSDLTPISRLSRDLREAAVTLTDDEARFLVDSYYMMQDARLRADGQLRALGESEEPNSVLSWLGEQNRTLENQVKGALDRYSNGHPIGRWMRSITGIGPVIAAGLLAHIDIERCATAGNIWSFAGLNPLAEWKKGEKRPWNARLKVLCWKLGESFVKVSGNESDYYGKIYAARKKLETERNEAGAFAEQAALILTKRKIGKDTDAFKAYSVGRLPPAHIHARAKRYAVKLFLAHLHEVWRKHAGLPVPLPYPIVFLGHAHIIPPPNQIERPMTEEEAAAARAKDSE